MAGQMAASWVAKKVALKVVDSAAKKAGMKVDTMVYLLADK